MLSRDFEILTLTLSENIRKMMHKEKSPALIFDQALISTAPSFLFQLVAAAFGQQE